VWQLHVANADGSDQRNISNDWANEYYPDWHPGTAFTGDAVPPCWLLISGDVNMRTGPGTGYGIAGTATEGMRLPVTGRNSSRTWWQADNNGRLVWISAQISTVSAAGECAAAPVVQ
jgi:SH3-like domain-containing protein